MLRPYRVEQMLRVLVRFRDGYSKSYDVDKAHIAAMDDVAQERRITRQTVQDMCTRCLSLPNIFKFRDLLEKWVTGDPKPLLGVLKQHTETGFHAEIEAVLIQDTVRGAASTPVVRQPSVRAAQRLHENFSLALDPETAKKLRVLSVMQGVSIPDWLQRVVADAIKKEYTVWLDSQR
jgi:hypothetical protein